MQNSSPGQLSPVLGKRLNPGRFLGEDSSTAGYARLSLLLFPKERVPGLLAGLPVQEFCKGSLPPLFRQFFFFSPRLPVVFPDPSLVGIC